MSKLRLVIINEIKYWKCTNCRKVLGAEGFYKNKNASNGLTPQCKSCHLEYYKKNIIRHREYARIHSQTTDIIRKRGKPRDKLKTNANSTLNNAVRIGKIIKPKECSECNRTGKIEGHHEDYSFPLDVIWLCIPCHNRRHWKYSEISSA